MAVHVEAELRHSDISSAEAHSVHVVFYYPQYLNFSHIDQVNMTETSNHPQPQHLPNGKGVIFFVSISLVNIIHVNNMSLSR